VNRRSVVLLLTLSLAAPAFADEHQSAPARWVHGAKTWVSGLWSKDASDWLERIGPALIEQDYQGTLVMVSGTSIETLGVFHAFDDGRERMRLVTLTGPHREVIRDDKMVMCIGTGMESVGYDADTTRHWNPPADSPTPASWKTTAQARRCRTRGARDCQVVDLQPKDGWRYGYRLWLDHDTGLPLRIALLGDGDQALEQMAFTDLRIGTRPSDADLRASTLQGLQRVQTLSPGKPSDPGWRIIAPPPGFTLRAGRRLGDSVQLLYSDGLASVSVYIEPVQPGNAANRRCAAARSTYMRSGKADDACRHRQGAGRHGRLLCPQRPSGQCRRHGQPMKHKSDTT